MFLNINLFLDKVQLRNKNTKFIISKVRFLLEFELKAAGNNYFYEVNKKNPRQTKHAKWIKKDPRWCLSSTHLKNTGINSLHISVKTIYI